MAAKKKAEGRWRALVIEQERSGESVREFARRRGLSPATLYWWRSRLQRRGSKPCRAPIELAPVTMLRTELPSRVEVAGAFELVFGGNRRLRIPVDFDRASLQRLLEVLEERC